MESKGIAKQARHISNKSSYILSREAHDLEELFWASNEGDIATMIFFAGLLVFLVSIIFTISQIFRIEVLFTVAFYGTVASTLGAILAFSHFLRKTQHLFHVHRAIKKKVQSVSSDVHGPIKLILSVTRTQIILTLMRLIYTGAACVALPWSVIENAIGENNSQGFPDKTITGFSVPFYIALGSVGLAVLQVVFFFFVEYVVRYNLSPKLGEFVCEVFCDELEELFRKLSCPLNEIDTKQVQEQKTL